MTDITSPLWTPRLLPHEFGLPATERSRELFHFHVLNTLSPELTRIPFGDSNPSWPTFGQTRPARGQRFRVLAAKARREMRRRYELRVSRPVGDRGVVGLAHAAALAREHAPDASDGVWEVLDRKRTLALLAKSPSTRCPSSEHPVAGRNCSSCSPGLNEDDSRPAFAARPASIHFSRCGRREASQRPQVNTPNRSRRVHRGQGLTHLQCSRPRRSRWRRQYRP
jgi:hypothetical protein